MAKLNEGFLDSITMPMSLARYAYSMHFDQKRIADSSIETLMKFVAVPWLKSNKKYIPLLRKLGNDDLEAGLTKVVTLMQKNFSERVHKNDLSDSEKQFLGESRIREANGNDLNKLNYYEAKANEWRERLAAAKTPKEIEDCKVELEAFETSIMFLKKKNGLSESRIREADDDDDLLGYGEETDEPITDVYDGELSGRPTGKWRLHPSELDYAADSRELEGWDQMDDPDTCEHDYPIAWKNEQAAAGPDLAKQDYTELLNQSIDTDIRNGAGGFKMAGDWDEGNVKWDKPFYDVGLKESTLFESILKGRK